MKNIIIKFVIVVLVLVFSSCEKLIDVEPISEIPASEMWKSERDARAGVNALYGLFRTAMRQNYYYWGEFRSDNFVQGSSLATDQMEVMNNLITSSHSSSSWATLFAMINQANLAIKYLPNSNINSIAVKEDLLAQSYAMRALGYFYAIRVWGDVPLYTEPNELFSEDLYRERTDANYILRNVVLEDLKKAESMTSVVVNKERKRISIMGIRAILADVYMWLGEYMLADQTIQTMKSMPDFIALAPDIDSWSRLFSEELQRKAPDNSPTVDEYSSKELIFLIHFDMAEVGAYGYSLVYRWFYGPKGNRMASISDVLVSKFEQGDLRKKEVVTDVSGDWRFTKFAKGLISAELSTTCEVAYPIYRMTDMILLQAEAKAHLGKWDDAIDLVKTIRERAGLTTPSSVSFTSTDQLIDFILKERQIELIGEGRRWFDLLRTNRWKQVMGPINGMSEDGNELFPIYYQHLDDNPKLKQNPYYGSSN